MRSSFLAAILWAATGGASFAAAQNGEGDDLVAGEAPNENTAAAQGSDTATAKPEESAVNPSGKNAAGEADSPREFRPSEEVMADTILTLPSDI